MEPIRVGEMAQAMGGELLSGDGGLRIESLCTDTRKLKKGDLFLALAGKNFDGHDYIAEAVERGSSGIVYARGVADDEREKWKKNGVVLIRVGDTLEALQGLARWYRSRFLVRVVAVTGSNGKTTTKDMIGRVAGSRFSVLVSEGTYNNHVGVPLTLLRLEAGHSLSVLEIGMNARGEIKKLAGLANPSVGVITNVGPAHLQFLGTIEEVAASKAELLEVIASRREGAAVLNSDDGRVSAMAKDFPLMVRRFGMGDDADVRGEEARVDGMGVRFRINFKLSKRKIDLLLPLLGLHNVSNALAAAATCELLGCQPEEIAAGLRDFRLPPMRMEVLDRDGITFINDAYNANPASVRAAIETLKGMGGRGRKVFVMGDMLELGEASDGAHREMGVLAARSGVDILVTVGEKSLLAVEAARGEGMPARSAVHCSKIEEVSKLLKRRVRKGDCVLIKGSRRMGMERVLKRGVGGRCFTTYCIH